MMRFGQLAYWFFVMLAMLLALQLGSDLGKAAAIFVVMMAVPIVGIILWFVLFKGVKPWRFGDSSDE